LPVVSSPALLDTFATVSAAMPARTKPLIPTMRPSSAPPTSAIAGNTNLRASMVLSR
jgi:hypothetical protein